MSLHAFEMMLRVNKRAGESGLRKVEEKLKITTEIKDHK